MTFDPKAHITKIKGKDYLEVKWRLMWFREDRPGWGIVTELIEHDAEKGRAVVRARVYDSESDMHGTVPLSTGYKQETRQGFPDYIEKAETGAIGRALAVLGYGTQFALELEEGDDVVDSPVGAYVPTDVREVEDADIVRRADDKHWERWLEVKTEAFRVGVKAQDMRLPCNRKDLIAYGKEIADQVAQRKRQGEAVRPVA